MARLVSFVLASLPLLVGCGRKDRAQPASTKLSASPSIGKSAAAVGAPRPLPLPPEPGRAELSFVGAFSAQIRGDGTACQGDGGFTVLSADLHGFGHQPDSTFSDSRRPKPSTTIFPPRHWSRSSARFTPSRRLTSNGYGSVPSSRRAPESPSARERALRVLPGRRRPGSQHARRARASHCQGPARPPLVGLM